MRTPAFPACKVAAVVRIMKNATMLENAMPTRVSNAMRRNCSEAWDGFLRSGDSCLLMGTSSTSCDVCQKNKYGLMVVPSTAIKAIRYAGSRETDGTTVERSACVQGTRTTNAVKT